MNILVVGSILKDVYLNLDTRTEHLESDSHGTEWLDLGFNASEHHFYNRISSLSGAAVSLEVLSKLGHSTTIAGSSLHLTPDGLSHVTSVLPHRYILIANEHPCYLTPSVYQTTEFTPPAHPVDYLYIDRSAELSANAAANINAYLDVSRSTRLILYLRHLHNPHLTSLIPRANLVFFENNRDQAELSQALASFSIDPAKLVSISDTQLSYLNITERITPSRVDISTHLSIYSIASATILGSFMLGHSVPHSLALARANVEHSRLNTSLSLTALEGVLQNTAPSENIELIAASLMLPGKGILAADESGGSIQKKFTGLHIPDTYNTRRDYRNIFFTTPNIEHYLTGIILFDETTHQLADTGQTFVDYLISRRIIPGVKVDQGLAKFPNSLETYTKGLDGLSTRLASYYAQGLRFAKWRAAFELRLSTTGAILTPTSHVVTENCRILAEYAHQCQAAGIVPIVEPELVYDSYYSIEQASAVTGRILDALFAALSDAKVNLHACILKVNMVLAGKHYPHPSTPAEVGRATAATLRAHVPAELAGVVFLSGGQTPEQATANLAAITSNGPFPWPVTFSFARALQDPALYTWAGDNSHTDTARQAFLSRLIANTDALKNSP